MIGSLGAQTRWQSRRVPGRPAQGERCRRCSGCGTRAGLYRHTAGRQGFGGRAAQASGRNQLAICEGLLRCAEALTGEGQAESSQAIYDRLRALADAPPQVRVAALRGAILVRGKDGIPLLLEAIRGSDYALAAAAVRSAMELPGREITDALVAELPKASAERQGLLICGIGRPRRAPGACRPCSRQRRAATASFASSRFAR